MTVSPDNNSLEVYTEWLQVDFSRFHPGWRNNWGATIKSEHLRELISDTPRLSQKIQKQVIEGAKTIVEALACKNLAGLEQIQYAEIFAEKANDKLIQIAGLAWHAASIKNYMNSGNAHHLIEILGEDMIRIALSHHGIVPASSEQPPLDELPQLINTDGLLCFYDWLRKFPEEIACQLIVLLPPPDNNLNIHHELNEDRCVVVEHILSQQHL